MKEILEPKTVTFNSNGGSPVPSQNLLKGDSVKRPADPVKSGVVFSGWFEDNETFILEWDFETIPTQNITLHAKWIENNCIVTFETNGGSEVPVQIVESGSKAEYPPNPAKDGYGFVAWYDNAGLIEPPYNFDEPVLADITLYAKWSDVICTITFNSNGGSEVAPQIIGEGGKISKSDDPTIDVTAGLYPGEPSPAVFDGWYYDDDPFDFNIPITRDITLTAHWRSTAINVSGQPENDHFSKAISYVNANPSAGTAYTLLLDNIGTASTGTIALSGGANLTVKGLVAVNIYGSFKVTGTASLTIGSNITLSDVSIDSAASITLSGNAAITTLTLNVDSSQNSSVTINSGWTGSVTTLNLKYDSNSINDVIDKWLGKKLLEGDVNAATVSKFGLGKFISTGATDSLSITPNYEIGNSGSNMGKLIAYVKKVADAGELTIFLDSLASDSECTIAWNGSNESDLKAIGEALNNAPTGVSVILDLSDSTITVIPEKAFSSIHPGASGDVYDDLPTLVGIILPDSVTKIESHAFQGCINLTNVTIPNGVTSIGTSAFYGCTSLTSITIPDKVMSIDIHAFGNCPNLTTVTFQGMIPSAGFSDDNLNPQFLGDLRDKYFAADGGIGSYTTDPPVTKDSVWTKSP
jgi:uncharacterized repeat protein (TIGR02543 family)